MVYTSNVDLPVDALALSSLESPKNRNKLVRTEPQKVKGNKGMIEMATGGYAILHLDQVRWMPHNLDLFIWQHEVDEWSKTVQTYDPDSIWILQSLKLKSLQWLHVFSIANVWSESPASVIFRWAAFSPWEDGAVKLGRVGVPGRRLGRRKKTFLFTTKEPH